jgi:hypothetical protein
MSATVETLISARAIIADPVKWTQHDYAKDASGNGVPPHSHSAVCFCAGGAIDKTSPSCVAAWDSRTALQQAAVDLYGVDSFVKVNDGEWAVEGMTPHEAILKTFDRAIEMAKAEAQDTEPEVV